MPPIWPTFCSTRWRTAPRLRSPVVGNAMTQEFIANMLGARRSGVTVAASKLERAGVISYERGLITVLDRPRLEELSCECYRVVKKETDVLLHYLPQRQVISNVGSIPR